MSISQATLDKIKQAVTDRTAANASGDLDTAAIKAREKAIADELTVKATALASNKTALDSAHVAIQALTDELSAVTVANARLTSLVQPAAPAATPPKV